MVCDKVRASFNAPTPQFHPLPIMGLGYRWSLDFTGPLPLTVRHNRYVLVMVEHFSKWIELVPSPNKSNEGVAYAFLNRVLSHFGAPAKVLTDQGMEFQGEFQVLCDKALIDHQTTFRDHPEADGLAERGIDGEEGIVQVWLVEGPPRGLGYSVTMVGHGISIQSLDILGFLLTLFSIVRLRSKLANNDSS
jgi:hypothetical protein